MERIKYTVNLDMIDNGIKNTGIRLKQCDSNVQLIINLSNYTYSETDVAHIYFKKSNGITYIADAALSSDNTVTCNFSGNETTEEGRLYFDVKIGTENIASSQSAVMDVVDGTYTGKIDTKSFNYNEIIIVKEELKKEIAEAQDAIKEINSIVQQGADEIIGEAKYYCELTMQYEQNAKTYANNAEDSLDQVYKKLELATFDLDENGNLIYTDNSSYRFIVDDNGYLNYNVYLEALTMSTLLVNNVDASDSHVCTIE